MIFGVTVHLAAIALAVWIVLGMLEGRAYRTRLRALWGQWAYSFGIGAGMYGLVRYDGKWIAEWSWFSFWVIPLATGLVVMRFRGN